MSNRLIKAIASEEETYLSFVCFACENHVSNLPARALYTASRQEEEEMCAALPAMLTEADVTPAALSMLDFVISEHISLCKGGYGSLWTACAEEEEKLAREAASYFRAKQTKGGSGEMRPRNISKTDFVNGCQCRRLLWLTKHKPDACATVDTKQTADGNEVGALARLYYPNAVTVELDRAERMAGKTKELLEGGAETICEATFVVDGLSCSVDILRVFEDSVDIIEVKSSTSVKDHQVTDVAFQAHVLGLAGYSVRNIYLMHLNGDYELEDELDIRFLFRMEDITYRVHSWLRGGKNMTSAIGRMRAIAAAEAPEPDCDLSKTCDKPHECPAKGYCFACKGIPEKSVFSMSGMTAAKKYELYAKGIITPEQLTQNHELLTGKQVACALDMQSRDVDKVYADKKNVLEFLKGLQYPLYLLDFESVQYAVPKYKGTTPYEQVPFQYSLHILTSPCDPPALHKEFLARAESGEDPREALADQLCRDIPENAMSMAYNSSFEKMVCRSLAKQYPDKAEHLLNIADNMVDLMIPFRNRWVSTPSMCGSYSIKAVLPALCGNDPSIDYHRLPVVHNGAEAMSIFADMATGRISDPAEIEEIRKGLLLYCGLDTMAMVKVLQKLYALCSE